MALLIIVLLAVAALIPGSTAGPLKSRAGSTAYQLQGNLNYTNFFDAFDFFTV
jgi:hypothetical protein